MARQSLEIAPREKKHWFLLIVSVAFTGLLLYRLYLEQPIRNTVILLPLAVFTAMLLLKRFGTTKTVSLTVDPEGMSFHYKQGTSYISWFDIETIGASSYASKDIVGIRLKNYDRYLETMSPALMTYMIYERPYEGGLFFSWILMRFRLTPLGRRVFSRNPALLVGQTPPTLWSGFAGLDIPAGFDRLGTLGFMVQTLLFSRLSTGYDLTIPSSEIDCPPKELVAILESYLTGQHRASGMEH